MVFLYEFFRYFSHVGEKLNCEKWGACALIKNLIGELETYLTGVGVKNTWLNLLATHISHQHSRFGYILEYEKFKNVNFLPNDLLSGLTVGEVGVLYEYSVAWQDKGLRKDRGQFFTPDDVANFIARKCTQFPQGVHWHDPCSGVGNLAWHVVNNQQDKETFLTKYMHLSDIDPLALLIARVLFTLSFQANNKELFHTIEENFTTSDFLNAHEEENFHQRYVVVNPPYVSVMKNDKFVTSETRNLYAYFLEKVIEHSDGFVSITPQSYTNSARFKKLRELLLNHGTRLTIYNFDNIPGNIFKGFKYGSDNSNTSNSVRASIIVASPNNDNKTQHRTTSLVRWRTAQRDELFTSVEKLLTPVKLTENFFPKVDTRFSSLYKESRNWVTLSSLTSEKVTPHVLYIPTSPRYFISATKTPISRSSLTELYFPNEGIMNKAYVLLNSSLAYWWWRVRDGGMTLSRETLNSTPTPNFLAPEGLIKKLELSERVNKIYKKNAGKYQENVKHPKELISLLNATVTPRYADVLISLHENSDIDFITQK